MGTKTYVFIFNVFEGEETTSHIETFENVANINAALDLYEAFMRGKTFETLGIYSEPS